MQWLRWHGDIAPDESCGYWSEDPKKENFVYFFQIHSCLHFGVLQKPLTFYSLAEGEYRTSAASTPATWNSTWQISLLATLGTTIKHFLGISEKEIKIIDSVNSSDLLIPLISITMQIVLQSFVSRV